jgi:hypothetical protein
MWLGLLMIAAILAFAPNLKIALALIVAFIAVGALISSNET